jgi:hypothetical protein
VSVAGAGSGAVAALQGFLAVGKTRHAHMEFSATLQ